MTDEKRAPLRPDPEPSRSIDRLSVPILDDEVRQRLTARFGAEIGPWWEKLPDVLGALRERWQVEWGSAIPRGSMSVVIRCRVPDGRPAVLKVSPDRVRLANEAAALERWTTVHTPSVLAVDESVGALLLEAIEPGTPSLRVKRVYGADSAIFLQNARSVRWNESVEVRESPQRSSDVFQRCPIEG